MLVEQKEQSSVALKVCCLVGLMERLMAAQKEELKVGCWELTKAENLVWMMDKSWAESKGGKRAVRWEQ